MAKDDYDKLVCVILTYLYARIKGKTDIKPEDYLQPMTKDFPVIEDYFNFILESMIKAGYIEGPTFTRTWSGEIISADGLSDIRITADGIHYLCENSIMRKMLEWLRDNAVTLLPGMSSTILSILSR